MRLDGKFLFMTEYSMKKKTNFTLIQLTQESYLSFQATMVLTTRRNATYMGGGGAPGASGVHALMAYTERLRPKGVPFSGFRYMKNANHVSINLSPPWGFSPPPGKALDEANCMYLSLIMVEIKTVFPSLKVIVKKVQYYLIS